MHERLGVRLPIIQAPMAGGPDTPELAAAVSEAGGLGSLGCAYLSAEQIDDAVARLRTRTNRPFALNLFIRSDAPDDPGAHERVRPVLDEFRHELGVFSNGAVRSSPPAFAA